MKHRTGNVQQQPTGGASTTLTKESPTQAAMDLPPIPSKVNDFANKAPGEERVEVVAEEVGWTDSLRGPLFWFCRAMGTIVD